MAEVGLRTAVKSRAALPGEWPENEVQRSGVPRITARGLRHTAASLAVSAGANVKAVQKMLGHASAAMTLDVYADLFDDDLEAVAVALDHAVTTQLVGGMWQKVRPADVTERINGP